MKQNIIAIDGARLKEEIDSQGFSASALSSLLRSKRSESYVATCCARNRMDEIDFDEVCRFIGVDTDYFRCIRIKDEDVTYKQLVKKFIDDELIRDKNAETCITDIGRRFRKYMEIASGNKDIPYLFKITCLFYELLDHDMKRKANTGFYGVRLRKRDEKGNDIDDVPVEEASLTERGKAVANADEASLTNDLLGSLIKQNNELLEAVKKTNDLMLSLYKKWE